MPKPRVLFLGSTYAGHHTSFLSLQANSRHDPRLEPLYRSVTGWRAEGAFERMTLLPRALRGRMRGVYEARALATFPRPDGIWLSATEVVAPFLWAQVGRWRRPLILDLDSTPSQLDTMAPWYFSRPPKRGVHKWWERAWFAALQRSVTVYRAWSEWTADGLRSEGVDDGRITVIPPGVPLDTWAVPHRPSRNLGTPMRLLFVGGDFTREGGDLLLDVMRSEFGRRFELDIVTRDAVETAYNVRVHRAEPNSPTLQRLFADAELFVMPTRAECFGIAATEAMASGLAVLMGNVGGAKDIVTPGRTGWLIEPTAVDLAAALNAALAARDSLPAMGAAARADAERRFDARTNDARVLDLILSCVARPLGQLDARLA